MYLLELFVENSARNGNGHFRFQETRSSRTIPKWTFLPNNPAGRELLTLITMGLGGRKISQCTPSPDGDRRKPSSARPGGPMCWPVITPLDHKNRGVSVMGSGVDVDANGHVTALRTKDLTLISWIVPARKLNILTQASAYLLLAYGAGVQTWAAGRGFSIHGSALSPHPFSLSPDAPCTLDQPR